MAFRGKDRLDAAMASAQSAPVRLAAAKEFVDRYRETASPGLGARFLESIESQFTGEELSAVQALRDQLQNAQAQIEQAGRAAQAAAETSRQRGLLAYYQQRLTACQADGKQSDEVAKLQTAIADLQKSVQP